MKTTGTQLATAEELNKFQQFLFEMDDVLEPFLAEANAAGYELDYSLNSLCILEEYLLSKTDDAKDGELLNRAARYVGEVFRKNVGGRWQLCLKDPEYLYFKLPVISGYSDKPIEFCPLEIVKNFTHKKIRKMLTTAVAAHLEFKGGKRDGAACQ
jgi:hypothetical protein